MNVSKEPNINLYHGDCMEAMKDMPDNAYDLAIVDPPYGIGLDMVTKVDSNKRAGRKNGSIVKHENKNWNDQAPGATYFNELNRVCKNTIVWGCNYYSEHVKGDGRIVHDKIMGTENTKFNWSHCDLASCSMFQRIVIFRYQWGGNKQNGKINWQNTGPDARIHPTQKPIALYYYCLKYAKKGFKILDTFGGSMSIAIACYDLGFDLDLWEIDEDYYKAGVERVKKHIAQGQLFNPAQKKPEVQQLTID